MANAMINLLKGSSANLRKKLQVGHDAAADLSLSRQLYR